MINVVPDSQNVQLFPYLPDNQNSQIIPASLDMEAFAYLPDNPNVQLFPYLPDNQNAQIIPASLEAKFIKLDDLLFKGAEPNSLILCTSSKKFSSRAHTLPTTSKL
jgi:hypothetical protein